MPQVTRGKKFWPFRCVKCSNVKILEEGWHTCECGGDMRCKGQVGWEPNQGVVGDDIPGGYVMEHLYPGRKVYSHTEHRAVIEQYNRENKTNWRISDYGNTGLTDQHFIKSAGMYVDLRTKEQRQQEMAEFLGLTLEDYQAQFS